jgi:hypothetical protein
MRLIVGHTTRDAVAEKLSDGSTQVLDDLFLSHLALSRPRQVGFAS